MRIRRPPPGQQRIPYLLPWDPLPPPPPPPPASRAPGDKEQGEEGDVLDLHPADLGHSSSPLRRSALSPQDGAVERGDNSAHQQGPADDGRSSRKRAPPSPERKEKEGSRCSRKNGRGWRCSQPTPKGFALCEYHLGKGAMKSESAETGRRGTTQLGRTEHFNKTPAAAVAPATAVAPKVDVTPPSPPSTSSSTTAAPKEDEPQPPSVQHC